MTTRKNKNLDNKKYISLLDAARVYGCTQKHFALMARQKKLQAVKIGRNWMTTIEWLEAYTKTADKNNGVSTDKTNKKVRKVSAKTKKIKKIIALTFLSLMLFICFSSVYASFKGEILKISDSIKNEITQIVSPHLKDSYKLQSQAIVETNKTIASVFEVGGLKINSSVKRFFRVVAIGARATCKDINGFFDSILVGTGNFVIDKTYNIVGGIINIARLVSDFVISVPNTLAKIANNLIASFKSFLPLYATWDGDGDQTIVSIRDLYKKIKDLRELIEGKTLLVNETTQQITIIKPTTVTNTNTQTTTPIDITAQLAMFKNELLSQVASDINDVQTKIGQTLVTQNNYYYSEAVAASRLDVVNNDVDFNEQVAMHKNLSVDGNLSVLGTSTFGGTVTMGGLTVDDMIINNLLTVPHASISDDFTSPIGTVIDLTSTNITGTHVSISDDLTVSDVFTAVDGSVSISDNFYFGDNMFLGNVLANTLYSSASFQTTGATEIDNTASISGATNIYGILTLDNDLIGIRASLSDSLTVGDTIVANVFTDNTATLSAGIFTGLNSLTTTNLFGTHVSISDDLTASTSEITDLTNHYLTTNELIFTTASGSNAEISSAGFDNLWATTFTDNILSINSGNITGGQSITTTNLFGTHASISDDLTIGDNIIFSDLMASISSNFYFGNDLLIGDVLEGGVSVAGNFEVSGNVTLGDSTADSLTVNSYVHSNLVPDNNTRYVGTTDNRWRYGYFDELTVATISATGADIGGTINQSFIINSDNISDDAEYAYLTFERGDPVTNASLKWDYVNTRFDFNFPVNIQGTLFTNNASISEDLAVTNNLTATNIFGTHVSISDDLETLNGIITSASIGALNVTGTTTLTGDLDSNGNVSIADTNIAFDGATTTFTTTGAFTLTPGGALTIGDNGDTLYLNSSDWDISTTGDMTGIGAITMDGALAMGANTITSGLINGQTISSAANFTGTLAVSGAVTLTTDLGVASGGTGVSTFTTNGILYGNSATSILVTAAGTSAQILQANGSGVPGFVTFSGDASVAVGGAITVADDSHAHIITDIDAFTSLQLATQLTDETGSGLAVFATSPQFTTSMTTAGTFAINPGGALTIGDNGDTLYLNSSDWDIGTDGAMTGISGITNDGAYTQTGVTANTFTGTSTFSNATYSALFTGGNVGIGTTAPYGNLQVSASGNVHLLTVGDKIDAVTDVQRGLAITAWAGSMYVDTKTNSGGTLNFRIGEGTEEGTARNWMTVDATNGNVGIGDTAPGYTLSVDGTASISSTLQVDGAATFASTATATGTLTANGTLDANGVVTLGDNGDNVTIDSNVWDITAAGAASGLTGVSSSGTITLSGLTASRALFTDASSNLAVTGTSAMLLNALSDETGSGLAVFATSPQFTTSMLTAGVFAINPGGALTIGDNGDTLYLNSSDWDISTTGDMTGIGAITADGTVTFSGTFDPNGAITLPTTGISGAGTGSGLDADLLDGTHVADLTEIITTKADITTRTESGFYQDGGSATIAEGWPENAGWYQLIASTHSNTGNYYSMQFAGSYDNSTSIYYRQTSNSGATAWNKMWHAGNDGTGSTLDADLWDGNQFASYLNQAVLTSSTPVFAGLNVTGSGTFGTNAYTYLYLRDDESTTAAKSIHANSNVMGFLNGAGSWMSYWDNAGNQINTGTITAPTFSGALSGNATTATTATNVNGGIVVTQNAASTWGDIRTGSIDSNTVYAYGRMCVGNNSGLCDSTGGTIITNSSVTSGTFSGALSGNATTATLASTATIYTDRTDASYYQAMWTTSGSTTLYSTANVAIKSSYPGAIMFRSAYTLEGNDTYGLYSNTGFNAAAGLWDTGNRVCSGATCNIGSTAITSGLINSQTISSAANFTGTLRAAGAVTFSNIATAPPAYVIETNGILSAGGWADLAEYMPLDSANHQSGELISARTPTQQEIDNESTKESFIGTLSSVSYDSQLIGVVSQPGTPGLGPVDRENYKAITLVGRVPVKVSTENGPINVGDYLTSSTTPGVAMKATKPGTVIGKALEEFSDTQTGSILVFVNLTWYDGGFTQTLNEVTDFTNAPLDKRTLTIDDLGNFSINATASVSQDLYVGNKLYVDGVDIKDEIEKIKLSLNSQGTTGAIIDTSNPLLPTSELMASVFQGLKDVGVEIYNGILKVAQIVVKTLVVEKNSDQTQSSIGEGVIVKDSVSAEIRSNQILPTSKIFVTFRNYYGPGWWINYQEKGMFIINITAPMSEDVKFDWWIVQTEAVEITETSEPTQTEPAPQDTQIDPEVSPISETDEPTVEEVLIIEPIIEEAPVTEDVPVIEEITVSEEQVVEPVSELVTEPTPEEVPTI